MTGHLHPLTLIGRKMVDTFRTMGFDVVDFPEVEDEWHNFDGLNVPREHPARDVQDTFFTTDGRLLRTHASTVQLRVAEVQRPPLRAIQLGRVFRNEATDATHEAIFHHLDGIAVDRHLTMGHLVETQRAFIESLFGRRVEYRFVPAYFPFVEPGMEVQMRWKGRWLEMWGSGMVHPQVLRNMQIDPQRFRGFAFGIGVERIAMLYWGIDDIRLFLSGDLRLISQF